jgi:hypothetical protein
MCGPEDKELKSKLRTSESIQKQIKEWGDGGKKEIRNTGIAETN